MEPHIKGQKDALVEFATRRSWIKQGSLLVASALAAPEISSVRWNPFSTTDVKLVAARNLVEGSQSRLFVAEANPVLFFFALLGAVAAVIDILKYFGIHPSFGQGVNYAQAGNGYSEFRTAEATFHQRGLQSFSGVSHSPIETYVAVLGARNDAGSAAGISMRCFDSSAVTVGNIEPSVIHAAGEFARGHYGLDQRRQARTLAITSRTKIALPGQSNELPVIHYETADGGFISYYPKPTPQYSAGLMAVHVPGFTNPAELRSIGLRA